MSYLVLARKYRPQTFDQVIKQEHVTKTLTNAVSLDRVAHAILFSGPRGTGKTTVARILAKAMNCKEGPCPVPCNVCKSCSEITSGNAVDVFEIDGASNNSVDQIRELRENVKYMPAHSLYKIYIIDEVHMLSMAAFNALLKTLEEPPAHVMFIFATTEPHKIPITILSRCRRHDFRRIDIESISKHMEMICAKEDINIAFESLSLIAREAGGSMRDALSLLDQVMSCAEGAITHDHILDILGVIDRKIIFDISVAILRGDIPRILEILDEIYNHGHDMKRLYADLIEHFRNLLIIKMGKKVNKLVDLPAHEIDLIHDQIKDVSATFLNQIFDLFFKEEPVIRFSKHPKLALEMLFIRIFQIKPAMSVDLLIEKLDNLRKGVFETEEENIPAATALPISPDCNKQVFDTGKRNIPVVEKKPDLTTFDPDENPDRAWKRMLEIILEKHPSLAANLTNSTLKKQDNHSLEIEVKGSSFNITMVKRNKNMAIIEKICKDFFGKDINVVINTKESRNKNSENRQEKSDIDLLKHEALNHPLVADAIEIFNGEVVNIKML